MELLTDTANEEGSFVVIATLSGTPLTVNWKMTDGRGNVVNSRTAETETPATTINIVLSGDDLALPDSNDTTRVVTVWGTYNSVTYGNGLYYTDEVSFDIQNHLNIPI